MATDSEKRKGFAGLEDMASEVVVPELPLRNAKDQSTPNMTSVPREDPSWGRPFQIDESVLRSSISKGMSSEKKWMIGVGIFIALIVIVNIKDNISGGGYSAPVAYEEMPSPGAGQLLSDNQIRYCLSQEIRLASWNLAVDQYSQTAIDSFNSAVAEYNSRCSSYKYRRGSLDRIRKEVESRRAELQSDGVSKASLFR